MVLKKQNMNFKFERSFIPLVIFFKFNTSLFFFSNPKYILIHHTQYFIINHI